MRHTTTSRLRRLALALATLAGSALPAAAQLAPGAPGPLRADYEGLFRQVLREPANVALNVRFAEVATSLGDHEAAIGALERILFHNPALARVRFELGVLYFRLGSYAMARSYFESALTAPDTPADVRARIAGFVVEIDRRLATTQWSVFAQAGLRHQTNANAGPNGPVVRAAGRDALLDRTFARRADWNAFGLAQVRHTYDFENQRGDLWETTAVAYYARQFRIERLNLGLAELQTGPRLALAPDELPGWAVRPYALVGAVTLGDAHYLTSWGVGLGLTIPVTPSLQIEPFVEARRRQFENTGDYPTAFEQTGRTVSAGFGLSGSLWGGLRWQGRLTVSRADALRDYFSYDGIAADLGLPLEFEGPWGGERRWTLLPTIGVARFVYDQPNPAVDPNRGRRDDEWRVGAVLDAPIHDWLGFSAQIQYAVTNSTVRNYDTRNLSVTFGPTIRF